MKTWVKRTGITVITLGVLALAIFLLLNLLLLIPIQGEPSAELWSQDDPYQPDAVETLQMQDGEDFKILVLSDLQLDISLPLKNWRALKIAKNLIQETQPDFIITTGDNTSWVFSGYMAKKVAKFLDSFEIPWAVTLGNHDGESRRDRNWHGNVYEAGECSLFEMGPSTVDGVGNFTVRITDNDTTAMLLVMLDSHEKRRYPTTISPEGEDYDFIHQNQIDWYQAQIEGESEHAYGSVATLLGQRVPSMAFFHIALPEYQDMMDLYEAGKLDPNTTFGEVNEKSYGPPYNSGLFEVMQDLGSTSHVFVGHDHVNNLSGIYEGIRLTYGLKTGPVSYYDKELQGGTLVTIEQKSHNITVEHIYADK